MFVSPETLEFGHVAIVLYMNAVFGSVFINNDQSTICQNLVKGDSGCHKVQISGVINQNHPFKLLEKLYKIQVTGEACTPKATMSSPRLNAPVMRVM